MIFTYQVKPQLQIVGRVVLFTIFVFFTLTINADTLWTDVGLTQASQQSRPASSFKLLPDKYRLLTLNDDQMKLQLGFTDNKLKSLKMNQQKANVTSTVLATVLPTPFTSKTNLKKIQLPKPDGTSLNLTLSDYKVMADELASKYPEIKTYRVDSRLNDGIYGVLDFTTQGFHAMLFMKDGSRFFIDPRMSDQSRFYISYYDKDYHPTGKAPHTCNIKKHNHKKFKRTESNKILQRSGDTLKTYRLAMTATGEYTNFHGGTTADALSAMTTTINRVNSIYERDLAVKLELVTNNDQIIYTNAGSDPFTGNSSGAMIGENQTNTDAVIGTGNYDVGHIMSTGGSGLASFGVICAANVKARGVTGIGQPIGDSFDIDFVSHEIGHQFGGDHTFNGTKNACGGGNREASTAFEPGSGVTIMAYAGICGNDNLQANSDAMFHIGSINQMSTFIDDNSGGGSCGVDSPLNNSTPIVNAGADYTIPANTPFELIGAAMDADGDNLSYSWEQIDTGQASDANVDTQDNAIFRTFLPLNNASRTFPKLSDILSNTTSLGEILPVAARPLNFSLAVRDGHGAVKKDDIIITVENSSGFKITSHNVQQSLTSPFQQLAWDIAGTAGAPINCATVRLFLSTDGGVNFTDLLGATTANDGSENVILTSGIMTSNARFKVKCDNNIFFDISDTDLTLNIQADISASTPILSNLGTNNVADPGEVIDIIIPLDNQTPSSITNLNGTISSSVNNVVIPDADSSYPDLASNTQADNVVPYKLQIPATLACGSNLPITLNASYISGGSQSKQFDFDISTGAMSNETETNANTLNIPDDSPAGIDSVIAVSGAGLVANPNITIDVDLTHTYRGDLNIKLTSPQGTTVQLKTTLALMGRVIG